MSDSWAGPEIRAVNDKADRREFIDLGFRLNRGDPNWVPPLRSEVAALLDPKKNPWFQHGVAQLFIAYRDGRAVGRISAHIDALALEQPTAQGFGPGTGNWGLLEAEDEATAHALIARAEKWLGARDMTRVVAPISLSVWDEPGLLTFGHDHPPTVMMGHDRPEYQAWVESAGYASVKQLKTWELDITRPFPPLIRRIIESGDRNERISIRTVDKSRFAEEAALILGILNDAWSDNWGFVPLTDSEIAYAGKKLKSIVFEDLIRIAEYDGEPVAFMITLPDFNEKLAELDGSLLPFGWIKLLWWMRKPRVRTMRVPLMGVVKRLQGSRLASQLAFMLIGQTNEAAVAHYGATRGEIGWILEDNQGMNAIAETLECTVNKVYDIYEKTLSHPSDQV